MLSRRRSGDCLKRFCRDELFSSSSSIPLCVLPLVLLLCFPLFVYSGPLSWASSRAAMSSDGDFGDTAECPSVPWRLLSSTTMLGVGALCRAFLLGVSRPEINGLDSFLEILESRQDPSQRSKGLLTGRWYTWLDDLGPRNQLANRCFVS